MSFRDRPLMFVAPTKRFLIPLTPPRDWSRYDRPAIHRLPPRTVCALDFREAQALLYLRQAS